MTDALSVAVADGDDPLRFPAECPVCARSATATVRLVKLFARRTVYERTWTWRRVDVRACADCAADHVMATRPSPAVVRTMRRRAGLHREPAARVSDVDACNLDACDVEGHHVHVRPVQPLGRVGALASAGLAMMGGGAFFVASGLRAGLRAATHTVWHGDPREAAAIAVLGLWLVIAGAALAGAAWILGRDVVAAPEWPDAQYATMRRGPLGGRYLIAMPATALARAVDFSDDRREGVGASWRTFSFARARYGRAFAVLNAERLYDGSAVPRQRPVRRRKVLYLVAGAVLAAMFAWSVFWS